MDFISILSIFVLACFVGYFVVWSVTPALHTPLMAVTNAISSVIIVGALIAAAAAGSATSKWLGLLAVTLASVVTTAIAMPIMPSRLPRWLVAGLDRPRRARMKQMPAMR